MGQFWYNNIIGGCLLACLLLPVSASAENAPEPSPVPPAVKDLQQLAWERFPSAALPERRVLDPMHSVRFTLPQGFVLEGIFTRGRKGQDVMIRARRQEALFIYTASGAKMQTEKDGKIDTQPFRSRELMLGVTLKSYLEEARVKGIHVLHHSRETFAGMPCVYVQQEEKGKREERYFFGDRETLYSFSFLLPESGSGDSQPDIQKVLDSLEIPPAYERVEIPGSGFSYEVPYGGVDLLKKAPPGDPHSLLQLHLDEKLMTGVIYQPLSKLPDYAALPESLDGLSTQDEENLAKVMTAQREKSFWEKRARGTLLSNRTFFTKVGDRPCMVEEVQTPSALDKSYVFVKNGMLLSLDFEVAGGKDNQAMLDHMAQSLAENRKEGHKHGRAGI